MVSEFCEKGYYLQPNCTKRGKDVGGDPTNTLQLHFINLWDENQVETRDIPPASQTNLLVLGAAVIVH